MKTNLLKSENGQIFYTGAKMELFVPSEYFKTRLAEEVGTGYKIFGYVRAYHYDERNDNRQSATKSVLAYPLMFYTVPDSVTVEKINFFGTEEKYHVFTYYKNSVVFANSEIIQDANNVQTFFNMLMNGKLDIVEYKTIPRMLQLCKIYNGVSFGVPAMYEEVIIADYYRNPDDPREPARFVAAVTDKDPFFARGISQREKVSYSSTFAGITFEDINAMMVMADNAKREGREEKISEVEKVTLGLK